MLAYKLQPEISTPDSSSKWQGQIQLNAEQLDCLTAVMLKILDNKCQMGSDVQQRFIDIYRTIEKNKSEIFDVAIHRFIQRVFDEPDILSLRHVHELRLYAEATIEKPVMKAFKQSFSFVMTA